MSSPRDRTLPRLFAVSDRGTLPGGDSGFDDWLDLLAEIGVGAVQLREKDLDDRDLYELTSRTRRRLPASTLVLVNGRIDIALAAGADGVHLPSDGPPVRSLRQRFGREIRIGVSTHEPAEVAAAAAEGADYAYFGPVFPTPSKARYGPPPGLAGLRRACDGDLPVFALGGVGMGSSAERLAEIAAAGAAGVAGIRAFQTLETLGPLKRSVEEAFAAVAGIPSEAPA